MPFVLTADQRDSRRTWDRVPRALGLLTGVPTLRAFERTAGDEFQGVLDDAAATVDAALVLVRDGPWSVGIGCGAVEEPLSFPTRAGRGPAFQAARTAVEAAKRRSGGIAVRVPEDRSPAQAAAALTAQDAESVLTLLAVVLDRRSELGWEAVDAFAATGSVSKAARTLGVTRQAVGQRLSIAHHKEEAAGRAAAGRLLLRCLEATDEDAAS